MWLKGGCYVALARLRADPFTRSELSRQGLEELSQNLWSGRCQTCGRELGEDAPTVVLVEDGDAVDGSLHHGACQRPRWIRSGGGLDLSAGYLTVASSMTMAPFGDAGRDPFRLVLLINPALERIRLLRTTRGRYRAATTRDFGKYGLRVPAPYPAEATDEIVAVWIRGGHLIVRVGPMIWPLPADQMPSAALEMIVAEGELIVAVTTAMDPSVGGLREPFKRVVRSGDVVACVAPLRRDEPPQIRTAAESDLALAAEHNESDWLPEIVHHPMPTFDPATGRFECGVGMDGSMYWQLLLPGDRATNGLIAGPPGIGKTSLLRLVLVEAYASLHFDIAIADPANRNGIVDTFANVAVDTARSQTETVGLLRSCVQEIFTRHANQELVGAPTKKRPGLLLAIDDADTVLSDPAAAELAVEVALRGPSVGVALAVAIDSLEPDRVAGRVDLLQALGADNIMIFDKAMLTSWAKIRQR